MRYAKRIPVLMCHRVGEPDHARDVYRICPDGFAAQMHAWLYRVVGIENFDI
ncbi:MAG: hypothetical protein ACYCY1_06440 [Sulfuriferula sp.]